MPSKVKIERPDHVDRSYWKKELGEESEPGGQNLVSTAHSLQPLGRASPNQLRTEPPVTLADGPEERSEATRVNSSRGPSGIMAPGDVVNGEQQVVFVGDKQEVVFVGRAQQVWWFFIFWRDEAAPL